MFYVFEYFFLTFYLSSYSSGSAKSGKIRLKAVLLAVEVDVVVVAVVDSDSSSGYICNGSISLYGYHLTVELVLFDCSW